MSEDIVIVAAQRTAVGKFGGIAGEDSCAGSRRDRRSRSAEARPASNAEQVEEVIMGQVLTAGVGQNAARQAVIKSRSSPVRPGA